MKNNFVIKKNKKSVKIITILLAATIYVYFCISKVFLKKFDFFLFFY